MLLILRLVVLAMMMLSIFNEWAYNLISWFNVSDWITFGLQIVYVRRRRLPAYGHELCAVARVLRKSTFVRIDCY